MTISMDSTTSRHRYHHASATKAPNKHGSKHDEHDKANPPTLLRLPRPYSNVAASPTAMLRSSAPTASSTIHVSASSMPTFVVQLPSSAVVQSDPYFGTNSPASTTTPLVNNNSINTDQQDNNNSNNNNNNNNAHLIGPIVGSVVGVIVISLVAFFLLRKRKTNNHVQSDAANNSTSSPWAYHQRKDSESGQSTLHETAYQLHPPPAYTSRDAKRLTADTLVSIDQRSSLSTMISKRQYMPQLAYSPSKASLNQRDQELGVSPSNTLIGTLSENDDDFKHNGRQRVPSYQPQVAMQPEEEVIHNEQCQQPPAEGEIQSYYNYLSQNDAHSRSLTEETHDQKS